MASSDGNNGAVSEIAQILAEGWLRLGVRSHTLPPDGSIPLDCNGLRSDVSEPAVNSTKHFAGRSSDV